VNKTGEGYYIDAPAMDSDVEQLAAFLEEAASERGLNGLQYDKINKLYKGEYLEGCDYRWAMWKREELQAEYVRTLRKMQKQFANQGNLPLAIDSLKRIITLEPDSEQDGRELISLYLNADNRSEALKVFKRLEQAVRIDLGLRLEEATVRLYEAIARNCGGEVLWEKSGQRPSQRFSS
jgi:two-component SAPR family response regulator